MVVVCADYVVDCIHHFGRNLWVIMACYCDIGLLGCKTLDTHIASGIIYLYAK